MADSFACISTLYTKLASQSLLKVAIKPSVVITMFEGLIGRIVAIWDA